ncbi:E3 ubiquitin-protein ligase WAV3-like [Papaver somniferum]|uniref:E3 ubiquitin-protein ligase WAV3-like n=1 Tax=Papaver somniferum TaxID=3469 RepID=UPI000E6F9705|nr:E3 ubiquitin-protein ligase WAV3-like [Papaver somniferum]
MGGTSKWWKVKVAFGFTLCLRPPKTIEGGNSSPSSSSIDVTSTTTTTNTSRRLSHATTPTRQSNQLLTQPGRSSDVQNVSKPPSGSPRLVKSVSRSSKKTCAICLGTMKLGHGHALFTAECSHSFHFHCIASNVKHGNQVCPVCRAKWKDIPFQGPTSDLSHGRARISPVDWLQEDGTAAILARPIRSASNRHTYRQSSEPDIFNDDDPIDVQPEVEATSIANRNEDIENSSTRSIAMKTFPELSAVQRSITRLNFSVLLNLKAHVTSSQLAPGCNQATSDVSQASRAPVDLVTILDISGSMMGTKLVLLKQAMGFVIQNLGPSDRLSVVAFSSTAHRLFPLRRMTDSGRQHALQAVNSLYANGGTNILEGLKKGAKVMEDRREKNPVCSIILLSDGQDSYTDRGQLPADFQSRLPFANRDGGNPGLLQIPVHAFGFGADHDPVMLHSISETSGGTFSFIEAEGVIQDAFAQCIGGLLSVVVQDLQVRIESIHPDICLGPLKAGSYATRVINNGRTGFIDVGDLYADEERDFLVSLNVPAGDSSNETKLINVQCVYKDPFSKETMSTNNMEVIVQRPEIVKEVVVSIEVDRQRNRLQAAEAMADSRSAAERGDLASAVCILESCRKGLLDTASARSGDQLCVSLNAELREMQERMASRQKYEESGRAYVLSGMSSHSWQRATARGDSTEMTTLVHAYQTPNMVNMLTRSQTMTIIPDSLSPPTARAPRSFTEKMMPR